MKKTVAMLLLALAATSATMGAEEETKRVTPYPLDRCIVSGEGLKTMGDAIVYRHGDREIKFCCRKCLKKFQADPDKYIALIDQTAKANSGAALEKPAPPEAPDRHREHHQE